MTAVDTYLSGALDQVKKILSLQDREPLSVTYGCFDKSYWHFKTKDFPSGMSQEYVLALALFSNVAERVGDFQQLSELCRNQALAGIEFSMKNSSARHEDDYFPGERAFGATVFTLYAFTETCLILNLPTTPRMLDFLCKRADWVIKKQEAGKLSNHHAIAGLALLNVAILSKMESYRRAALSKIDEVLSWQTDEGWFPEYGGFDPGYHTVTIDFLAQFYVKSPSKSLHTGLLKAVNLSKDMMCPDGSFSGVCGSRNTDIFHACGFEICRSLFPAAKYVSDGYKSAKHNNFLQFVGDDYTFGHSLISDLNAAQFILNDANYSFTWSFDKRESSQPRIYSDSGIAIYSQKRYWIILNWKKGGAGRIYIGDKLAYQEAGLIIEEGAKMLTSNHWNEKAELKILNFENDAVQLELEQPLAPVKQRLLNGWTFIAFRILNRLFENFELPGVLMRRLIQRLAINDGATIGCEVRRVFYLSDTIIEIRSTVDDRRGLYRGATRVSRFIPKYIAVSNNLVMQNATLSDAVFQKNHTGLSLTEELRL